MTGLTNIYGDLILTASDLQASPARTITMSGTNQTINLMEGQLPEPMLELEMIYFSNIYGSSTTVNGNATTNSDNEKKFFNININTGGMLELSRGILCKYGTFTVDGDLKISDNGYAPSSGQSPTYGSLSTLIYNSSSNYGRGNEWSSTSGAGYPNNVTIAQGVLT